MRNQSIVLSVHVFVLEFRLIFVSGGGGGVNLHAKNFEFQFRPFSKQELNFFFGTYQSKSFGF